MRKFFVLGFSVVVVLLVLAAGLVVKSFNVIDSVSGAVSSFNASLPLASSTVSSASSKPNVVIVLTDDQPKGMMAALPTVLSSIGAQGVSYSDAVVSTSLCCPSRTSLLTGLFSNKTRVFGNKARTAGGYSTFKRFGNEKRTFVRKLSQSGYATGLFGKYLNEYAPKDGMSKPVGWDRFNVFDAKKRSGNYFKYKYTTDMFPVSLDSASSVPLKVVDGNGMYSTSRFGAATVDFIREVPADKPVFALFAPYAAHGKWLPEPRYAGQSLSSSSLVDDPGFNRKPAKNFPKFVKKQKRLSERVQVRNWKKQSVVLRSVDDQVRDIVSALESTGRLDNTLLVFTSDNGYHHGQQRLIKKNVAFRSASDVDLFVRWPVGTPGVVPGSVVSSIKAANVDVTASVLNIAGVSAAGDGVDLRGVRLGLPLMATVWRKGNAFMPAYCGWRSSVGSFVRYGSGEETLFDYRTDPFELRNVVGSDHGLRQSFVKQARRACTGLPSLFGSSFDSPVGAQPSSARDEE